jgi:hypothetical protein
MKLVGFKSLTILRPSIISGNRDKSRFAEGIALGLSRILAPILPKKFHVNPAPKIAAVLVDSIIAAEPGCHYLYAESLADTRSKQYREQPIETGVYSKYSRMAQPLHP